MNEEIRPNKLPAMPSDQVKARAQAILDFRGLPPYTPERIGPMVLAEEAQIISEFVTYWLPYLVQKR